MARYIEKLHQLNKTLHNIHRGLCKSYRKDIADTLIPYIREDFEKFLKQLLEHTISYANARWDLEYNSFRWSINIKVPKWESIEQSEKAVPYEELIKKVEENKNLSEIFIVDWFYGITDVHNVLQTIDPSKEPEKAAEWACKIPNIDVIRSSFLLTSIKDDIKNTIVDILRKYGCQVNVVRGPSGAIVYTYYMEIVCGNIALTSEVHVRPLEVEMKIWKLEEE